MSDTPENAALRKTGWQPVPLPLKILSVVLVLWLMGSVMNLPNLYHNGMPLFGSIVYGINAAMLPLLVDILGPAIFLFALWSRRSWAVYWAFAYNGIFILNGIVALFAVREELGLPQVLLPTLISVVFLAVIFWKRGYFNEDRKASTT